MRIRIGPALMVVMLGFAAGCSMKRMAPTSHYESVMTLTSMMTGWFDSSEQAAADPDNYANIRLVMRPIWKARLDGRWLYVEQAASDSLDQPYRQRVYHIHRSTTGGIVSDVYSFVGDPLQFAAMWNDAGGQRRFTTDDIELREGCSIELQAAEGGVFVGATDGDACASTLRGAAYATSEVRIEADRLISWDRGWTSDGEQAWGATEGGYIFVKRGNGAPAATE